MCTGGYMAEQGEYAGPGLSCGICGSAELAPAIEKGGYRYSVCAGCGVCVLCPMPEGSFLEGLYEDFMDLECDGVKMSEHFSDNFRGAYFREKDLDFEDLGFEFTEKMRVLDVGCADGIFLKYLRDRHGIDGEGVDVSKKMVAMGEADGLKCSTAPLSGLAGPYDVITLWDVIEHLRAPLESLKEIKRLLAGDGALIIQTPCRGVLSEAYGSAWIQYQPPYHLHIFDFDSLTHLLKRAGFRTVAWVRFGAGITDGANAVKPVFDHVVKDMGIGDTIVLWARKKARRK